MLSNLTAINKHIWLIFFLALAVRITFVSLFPQPAPDSAGYDGIATNLLSIHSYSVDGVNPDMEKPPLYSLFLAGVYLVFGHSLLAVRLLQAFLDSISCLIIYSISQRIFDNRKISLIAGLAASLHPEMVASTAYILSETLATFLITTSTWALIRAASGQNKLSYLGAGALLGLATLCRPITLIFPAFLLIALIVFSRQRGRVIALTLLFSLAMASIIAPWTLRNYRLSGEFLPIGVGGGANLWIGSYQPWDGDYNYKDLSDKLEIHQGASSQIEIDERLRREAIKNIKNNPLGYLRLCVKKFGRFWFLIPGNKEVLKGKVLIKGLLYTFHFIILFFFVLGLRFVKRNWTIAALPPLLIILYFTLMHVILFTIPRYRIPIIPLILVFSAIGFYQVINLIFRPRLLLSDR